MDKWTRRPCLRCLGESLGALGCMQAQKMGGRLLGWAVVTWQIVTARSNFLRETDTLLGQPADAQLRIKLPPAERGVEKKLGSSN